MQKIRPEQMAQLDQAAREDFHRRLADYLREELPEETGGMDDAALQQHIELSEKRANGYGVHSEASVAQWVCLTFAAGLQFDEIPEVQDYLTSPDAEVSQEEKVSLLVDELAGDGEESDE